MSMSNTTKELSLPLIDSQQANYQSRNKTNGSPRADSSNSSKQQSQSQNNKPNQSPHRSKSSQTDKQSDDDDDSDSSDKENESQHSSSSDRPEDQSGDDDPSEDKRIISIKQGAFEWNDHDHERLSKRLKSSIWTRLYSKLRPSRSKLSRAHLYGTNQISSTRYSVITFIPVMLFEKLAPWINPANFYFLVIAIMQTFPSISTTQGRPSILLPLFIVIVISAVKDGLEDYGRAKQDYAKNNAEFKTLRNGHYKKIASKDLLVGDICMVEDNQRVPADLVILSSGISGGSLAHVDTKNLDGETNLKPKAVPKSLLKRYRSDWKKMRDMSLTVRCDPPNGDMRGFSGEISVDQAQKSEPLTLDNFVLSDCLIRNTPWIIGLIVYSGEQTKIRENMKSQIGEARRKETRVFQMTKRIFVLMVVVQFAMCALAAGLAGWYQYNNLKGAEEASWYLHTDDESVQQTIFLRFMTWFIQLHDLVPISLFVSLELVQFLQAMFMQWDDQMRHFINGEQLSTRVNSSSLNEELAQVSMIFSDKTGTLTENSMVFKKCVIGSARYGHGLTEAGAIKEAREQGKDLGEAMREFQRKREENRKEASSENGDNEDHHAQYKKHVEFDEMDEIRSLLSKSKHEYGQIKGDFQEAAQAKQEEKEQKEEDSVDNETDSSDDKGSDVSTQKNSSDHQNSSSSSPQSSKHKPSSSSKRPNSSNKQPDNEEHSPASTESSQSTKKQRSNSSKAGNSRSNRDETQSAQSKSSSNQHSSRSTKTNSAKESKSNSKSSSSPKSDESRDDSEEQCNLVREFFYCLCLNSSVFPKIKDEEVAGEEASDSDSSDDDEDTGIVNVVVNPMRNALASVAEQAQGAVENLSVMTGMTGGADDDDDESEKRSIDDGEAPEAEKQPDQEDTEGFDDANSGLIVNLEASSPDETALTSMAAMVGFELYSRTEGLVRVRVRDFDDSHADKSDDKSSSDQGSYHFEDFEEVIMIDYNSKRKRMTVIVRPFNEDGQPSDKVKIYSKGADTAIGKLLADDDPYWTKSINPALEDFGSESLRTLVYAYSEQDASFFDKYRDRMDDALKTQGKSENGHADGECSKDCKICKVEQEIEESAELKSLGCSGIEDKLQEGVPQALQTLLDAGIKIWVLTGDTTSTAINIAMSCNLIDSEMENDGRLFVLDKDIRTTEALRKSIDEALSTIEKTQSDEDEDDEPVLFGLAIHADVWKLLHKSEAKNDDEQDGQSKEAHHSHSPLDLFRLSKLNKSPSHVAESDSDDEKPSEENKPRHNLRRNDSEASDMAESDDDTLIDHFFRLCSHCQSVVACRLDPKEKADIVDEMRTRENKTCLAIGDGNNDALMIKHADIGIGIAGVEGTSAVASSDFALSQFRFLPRLLLVHGRLNHRRIAIMVNYIFYKTAFIVWALFLFGVYSEFSGQVILLDWMFQLHNLVYSSLPILVFAIFDYDFSAKTLSDHPEIYQLTRFKQRHMHFAKAFFARHTSNLFFSYWDFFEWITVSIIHGCICFFLCIYALNQPVSIDPSGVEYGVFDQGSVMYTAVIITTNLMLTFFFGSWTWLHHVAIWGSIALYFAAFAVFSASTIFDIGGASLLYTFYRLALLPAFWLILVCSVGACLIVTMLWQYGKSIFAVKAEQVWREAQVLGKLDNPADKRKASDDHKISMNEAVSSPRVARQSSTSRLRDEDKPAQQPYTGSLFSYTPSIRRIRAST